MKSSRREYFIEYKVRFVNGNEKLKINSIRIIKDWIISY